MRESFNQSIHERRTPRQAATSSAPVRVVSRKQTRRRFVGRVDVGNLQKRRFRKRRSSARSREEPRNGDGVSMWWADESMEDYHFHARRQYREGRGTVMAICAKASPLAANGLYLVSRDQIPKAASTGPISEMASPEYVLSWNDRLSTPAAEVTRNWSVRASTKSGQAFRDSDDRSTWIPCQIRDSGQATAIFPESRSSEQYAVIRTSPMPSLRSSQYERPFRIWWRYLASLKARPDPRSLPK